jgi:hypothetical protein
MFIVYLMTKSNKIEKKKICVMCPLTNEIENWRTTFKNILLNKNTIMNGVCDLSSSCPKMCRRIFDY